MTRFPDYYRYAVALAVACPFLACAIPPARALEFHPTLSVSQEYTDNVSEERYERREDFVTRAMPGLSLLHKGPRYEADVTYAFDYRFYARGTHGDETTHNLKSRVLARGLNERLFLEISDTYQRVSLDVGRDTARETLFTNQTDQNVLTISPYIVLQPAASLNVRTGYRYVNTWYSDESAVDKERHEAYLKGTYELSARLAATGDYRFVIEEAGAESLRRHTGTAGLRYRVDAGNEFFGNIGKTWTSYRQGNSSSNLTWDAGMTRLFSSVAVTAATGVQYAENPRRTSTKETFYSLEVKKPYSRGTVAVKGGYTHYADGSDDADSTRKYGGTVSIHHGFGRIAADAAFTGNHYVQTGPHATTRHFFTDTGLSYSITDTLVVSLSYRHVAYASREIEDDNYTVNRVLLEVRKTF